MSYQENISSMNDSILLKLAVCKYIEVYLSTHYHLLTLSPRESIFLRDVFWFPVALAVFWLMTSSHVTFFLTVTYFLEKKHTTYSRLYVQLAVCIVHTTIHFWHWNKAVLLLYCFCFQYCIYMVLFFVFYLYFM